MVSETIHQMLNQLDTLLKSAQYMLPIIVRFRTAASTHLLHVKSVVISEHNVAVETPECVGITFTFDQLESIETLVDANGKPVFMNEFNDGQDTVLEYKREVDHEAFVLAPQAASLVAGEQKAIFDFAHGVSVRQDHVPASDEMAIFMVEAA